MNAWVNLTRSSFNTISTLKIMKERLVKIFYIIQHIQRKNLSIPNFMIVYPGLNIRPTGASVILVHRFCLYFIYTFLFRITSFSAIDADILHYLKNILKWKIYEESKLVCSQHPVVLIIFRLLLSSCFNECDD